VIDVDGRIDLERARREAKALLRTWRAEGRSGVKLADAQLAVARELGARSWPALVARVEAEAVARDERARAFVEAATEGRRDRADALLALEPELARAGVDCALVLGDLERVPVAEVAAAAGVGSRGWPALCYVTFSAYLGGERTEALLACARALLAAGADVDSAWVHPEYGPQSALSGAAGVAHEPRMTALLLEAGANPDDNESVYHAVQEPGLSCLRLLLEAGAAIVGTNALGHALDREDPRALELLLSRLDGVGDGERVGLGALVPAAVWRERSPEFLRLLAGAGADLEAVGRESGERAYALAVRFGRDDLAQTLVELGARPQASAFDELVGACRRGDEARARELLAGDDALLARLRDDEMIARAAADGNDGAVALLHDLGVPLSNRGGGMGGTPLHWAAWWGRVSTVELLLDRGADPLADSPNLFSTPLGWAVHGSRNSPRAGDEDYLVVARRLAEAGAPIEPRYADAAVGPLADWLEAEPDVAPPAVAEDVDGYGEAAWRAQAAYLRALAAGAATRAIGDGFAVRTGASSNAENGVVCSAATDEDIAAAGAFLDGEPAQWLTGDPALMDRLATAGWLPERRAVTMGARAAAPVGAGRLPAGVRLRGDRAPHLWIAAAERAGLVDDIGVAIANATAAAVRHAEALAHDGDDEPPVGFAVTFAADDVVVLRELFVEEAWRRRGIGRALLQAAFADAPVGATLIVAPTRTSAAFFARLGFTLVRCPPDRVAYLP
jgi:GNAT superfamily N-acetyltransferase